MVAPSWRHLGAMVALWWRHRGAIVVSQRYRGNHLNHLTIMALSLNHSAIVELWWRYHGAILALWCVVATVTPSWRYGGAMYRGTIVAPSWRYGGATVAPRWRHRNTVVTPLVC